MRGEESQVRKTVCIPKALDDRVFQALAKPGMEDHSYSNVVREALTLYLSFLAFNQGGSPDVDARIQD